MLYVYDLEAARVALIEKDWKGAALGYRKALETARQRNPSANVLQAVLLVDQAIALGLSKDFAGAQRVLREKVASWASTLEHGDKLDAPCASAQGIELLASLELKAGQCAQGKRLRERAARARSECKDGGDGSWSEGPSYANFRAENACNQAPPLKAEHFME